MAIHTVRETVRDRVFAVSILFAVGMLAAALALSPLAAGERNRLVQDLGLASIAGIGLMLAVFVGTSLVFREMERRTIYTLLARPIGRTEYLVGKYLGMVATILLNLSIMFAFFALLVHFHLHSFRHELVFAVGLIGVELAVITAFSLFFSVVASPFLGAVFTIFLFISGHLSRDIVRFAEMLPEGPGRMMFRGVGYLLPNLQLFNVKGMAVYGKHIGLDYVAFAAGYGALYVAAMVMLALVLFRRKDLQ